MIAALTYQSPSSTQDTEALVQKTLLEFCPGHYIRSKFNIADYTLCQSITVMLRGGKRYKRTLFTPEKRSNAGFSADPFRREFMWSGPITDAPASFRSREAFQAPIGVINYVVTTGSHPSMLNDCDQNSLDEPLMHHSQDRRRVMARNNGAFVVASFGIISPFGKSRTSIFASCSYQGEKFWEYAQYLPRMRAYRMGQGEAQKKPVLRRGQVENP
ncbi:hypothetical protein DFH08DRAFT_892175 [Mycena albidolilacea]|uniref:Uncharacterized protein n=1 Tax=Mycena albidolilacea TaxID=1033008 RepID=A0AAD6ZDD2_9AGAR|nr:hypothetical protein DFH08DRAFT_892175 [Mycena albidolilacea]